jgi:hypothetical protein
VAVGADQLQHLVHLVVLHADEDGGVALLQESAGRVQASCSELALQERVHEGAGVLVVDDRGDELHWAAPRL